MIILTANTANKVALPLHDQVTFKSLTLPFFIFRVADDFTSASTVFRATNASTATTRYHLFNITVTGSTDDEILSASTIFLDRSGQYTYEVFIQESNSLNIVSSAASIDTGRLLLKYTGDTTDSRVPGLYQPNQDANDLYL